MPTLGPITSWIKSLIKYAYDNATEEDRRFLQLDDGPPNLHRLAHEVRAWSSTVAWLFAILASDHSWREVIGKVTVSSPIIT